ncbi:MAG: O-antigen ligase family protein [Thermonemataceae bacterium]
MLLVINWLCSLDFRQKLLYWRKQPVVWLTVSLCFAYFISGLYSTNTAAWLAAAHMKLHILAAPLVILTSKPISTRQWHQLLSLFVLAVMLATFVDFAVAFYKHYQYNQFQYWQPSFFFYHPLAYTLQHAGYTSLYINFCLVILGIFILQTPATKRKKLLGALLILYFTGFLLLLGSRTSLLTFILLLLSFFILLFKQRHLLKVGVVMLVAAVSISIVVIALSQPLQVRLRSLLTETASTSQIKIDGKQDYSMGRSWDGIPLRIALWRCAWEAIQDAPPLWGVGAGDIKEVLNEVYKEKKFRFAYYKGRHFGPHNQYLSTWLELGLIGIGLLLSILFVPLYQAFRYKNYLCFHFLILVGIFMFSESIFNVQKGIGFFSLFYALSVHQIMVRE